MNPWMEYDTIVSMPEDPGIIVYKTYQKANGEYFQYDTDGMYEVYATKAANGDMVPVVYDGDGITEMSSAEQSALPSLPTWPVENSVKLYQTFVGPNGEFTADADSTVGGVTTANASIFAYKDMGSNL